MLIRLLIVVSQVKLEPSILNIYLKSTEVKLVGGSGSHEGNIFVGGAPVCDDGHDADNALVVCR